VVLVEYGKAKKWWNGEQQDTQSVCITTLLVTSNLSTFAHIQCLRVDAVSSLRWTKTEKAVKRTANLCSRDEFLASIEFQIPGIQPPFCPLRHLEVKRFHISTKSQCTESRQLKIESLCYLNAPTIHNSSRKITCG
jgi:hypothetical protein